MPFRDTQDGQVISESSDKTFEKPQDIAQNCVELIKEDAQQAQIIQGWRVASVGSKDYPRLMLLNVILGASGLSSRLFLELREKKGLALH